MSEPEMVMDVGHFYDGGNALWAAVRRLAGNGECADRLISMRHKAQLNPIS